MNDLQEKQKRCKAIAEEYNFSLVAEWKGGKDFWHVWHTPRLIYRLSYKEYVERIIEIAENKPENEIGEIFHLMKPVDHIFRSKAYDAWSKAYEAWSKADEKEIEQTHRDECLDCKWDGLKLPQMRG